MNEDFVKGWKAARSYWSANHGSLSPYPPELANKPVEAPPGSVGETTEPDEED